MSNLRTMLAVHVYVADALGLDGTYDEIEARLMALAMATKGQDGG